MRRTPALIAGGGPAGATIATMLARGGATPIVLERSRDAHDPVCGGFLGGDALALLARLGIDPGALGARPIRRARLIARGAVAEAELPFTAAGLSRRTLDAALLAHAQHNGAAIERGTSVRRIDTDRRCLHLSDGAVIGAGAIFLATGKYEVRGLTRRAVADDDPSLGLRVRLTPSPALARTLAGVIELHLFRHGYAGLLLQEDGAVNLCLAVAQSRLRAAGGQAEQLIASLAPEAPRLVDRFGAASEAGRWSSIARVPYGWRMRHGREGMFRLGDQAAVIPSLAGDGIAIALDSGMRAAHCFLQDGAEAATRFQADFAKRAHRPIAVANLLKHWGETPWIARALTALVDRAPGLLGHAATLTRIAPP